MNCATRSRRDSKSPYPQRPRKLKALIIDDEKDVCRLLGNILKSRNIRWLSASSIAEAEHILSPAHAPSIIFLDNQLPDGLGVNYVVKLKKRFPATYVVMITGEDDEANRKKAFSAGVDYFTGKPFSSEFINTTLDYTIGK